MEAAQLSSEGAAAIAKIHPLKVFFLASCSLDIRLWVVETITDGVEQQQFSAFLCSAESIVLVWGDCSKCYQVSHYYAAESSLISFFFQLNFLFWNYLKVLWSPTQKTSNPFFLNFIIRYIPVTLFKAFKAFLFLFFFAAKVAFIWCCPCQLSPRNMHLFFQLPTNI